MIMPTLFKKITEGKAIIYVPVEEKISKDLPVFYNPLMELNRSISVLLLNSLEKKDLRIADPLAGTGVRASRFLAELDKGKIEELHINDGSVDAVKIIKKNLKNIKNLTKTKKNVFVSKLEANKFLLGNQGFDYIDIDPFGSPNSFLDSAVKRISRGGVLAVTATDTACMCGTYPTACRRKYYSEPIRCEQMHELGLRILIRKVQLIASQYEKALTPIFSYAKEHYFRVFFIAESSNTKTDSILKQHKLIVFDKKTGKLDIVTNLLDLKLTKDHIIGGPMWTGELWNIQLVEKMKKINDDKKLDKFLGVILDESKIPSFGFYHIHSLCKKNQIKDLPRHEEIISRINSKRFLASRTHVSDIGIRSNIDFAGLLDILKKID